MGRKQIPSRYVNDIQCPLDLDAIIMSDDCTPEQIEMNLNVGDDILYDAIRLSVNSSWLLKLDVLRRFSSTVRRRLFKNIEAFPMLTSTYFLLQVSECHSEGMSEIQEEVERLVYWEHPTTFSSIQLMNPHTMLGGGMGEEDALIMNGKSTLHDVLVNRILKFLKSGDKQDVDFTQSLFLVELLSTKFFSSESEACQLTILGNMDRYFKHLGKFRKPASLKSAYTSRNSVFPPQTLLKHVLSASSNYTMNVKMLAWKQLLKKVESVFAGKSVKMTSMFRIFNSFAVDKVWTEEITEELKKKEVKIDEVVEWLKNSEGVFESFELDCTLRNLDATIFLCELLFDKNYFKMLDGMMNFQDEDVRLRLMDKVSELMLNG